MVDVRDALFEIDAAFYRAEHFVRRAKHAVKESEFLTEQFVDAYVGCVLSVQEIDHHHIELLTIAMAPANALFNALWIPGQIVVHYQITELQVDAFRRGLGRDHDFGVIPEMLDERLPHVGGRRTRDLVGSLVARKPV